MSALVRQPLPGTSGLIVTSHSIDNLFDYCARKFEFAQIYEKRPVDRESGYAADVGTAIHRGIQTWLIAKAEGMSDESARVMGSWAFISTFPWKQEEDQRQKTRTFELAVAALWESWDHEFWNEWELVKVHVRGEDRWAVEVPWLLIHKTFGPTDDGRYFGTQGTIDMIMRNRLSGEICPIDIKSTIYDKDLTRAMYEYSGQQMGYGQVVQAMLGNLIRDLTVWYFIIRINPIEQSVEPKEFHKNQDQLEDYWLDKMDRLERMKKYANQHRFPRANGGCFSWGTECTYFSICASRDQDLLNEWFSDTMNAKQLEHPDWWVTLEI